MTDTETLPAAAAMEQDDDDDDFEARQRAARERVEAFERAQKEKAAQKQADLLQAHYDQMEQKRQETFRQVEAFQEAQQQQQQQQNQQQQQSNSNDTEPNEEADAPPPTPQEAAAEVNSKPPKKLSREEERALLQARLDREEAERKAKLQAVADQKERNRLERERTRERLKEQARLEQQRLAEEQIQASRANMEELARIAKEQQERLLALQTTKPKPPQPTQPEAPTSTAPPRLLGPKRKSTYLQVKESDNPAHWDDASSIASSDLQEYQQRLAQAMEAVPEEADDVEEFQKFRAKKSKRHSKMEPKEMEWTLDDLDLSELETTEERQAALEVYDQQLAAQGYEVNLDDLDLDDVESFEKFKASQSKTKRNSSSRIDTSRGGDKEWHFLDHFDPNAYSNSKEREAAFQAYKKQLAGQGMDLDDLGLEDADDFQKFVSSSSSKTSKRHSTHIDTSRGARQSAWNLDDFDPTAYTTVAEREAAFQAYTQQLAAQGMIPPPQKQGVNRSSSSKKGKQQRRATTTVDTSKPPDMDWEDPAVVDKMSNSGRSLDYSEKSVEMMADESKNSTKSSSKRKSSTTKRIPRRTIRRQRSSSLSAMDRNQSGVRRVKTADGPPTSERPSYNWTAPDFDWSTFQNEGARRKKKAAAMKRSATVTVSPVRERKKTPSRSSGRRSSTMGTPERGIARQRSSSLTDMKRGRAPKKEDSSSRGRRSKSTSRSRSRSKSKSKRKSMRKSKTMDDAPDIAMDGPTPAPKRGLTRQRSSSLSAMDRGRRRRSTVKGESSSSSSKKDKKKDKKSRSPTATSDTSMSPPSSPKRALDRQLSSSLSELRADRDRNKRGSVSVRGTRSSLVEKDSTSKRGSVSVRGRRSSTADKESSKKDKKKDSSISRRGVTRQRSSSLSELRTNRDKSISKRKSRTSKSNNNNDSKSGGISEESPHAFYDWISHSKDAISRLESKKAALEERRNRKKEQRKERRTEQTLQQMSQEYEAKMAQLKDSLEQAHSQQLAHIKMELTGQLDELKGAMEEQKRLREEEEARKAQQALEEEEARRMSESIKADEMVINVVDSLDEDEDIMDSSGDLDGNEMEDSEKTDEAMDEAGVESVPSGESEEVDANVANEEHGKAAMEDKDGDMNGSESSMEGYVNVMGHYVKVEVAEDAPAKAEESTKGTDDPEQSGETGAEKGGTTEGSDDQAATDAAKDIKEDVTGEPSGDEVPAESSMEEDGPTPAEPETEHSAAEEREEDGPPTPVTTKTEEGDAKASQSGEVKEGNKEPPKESVTDGATTNVEKDISTTDGQDKNGKKKREGEANQAKQQTVKKGKAASGAKKTAPAGKKTATPAQEPSAAKGDSDKETPTAKPATTKRGSTTATKKPETKNDEKGPKGAPTSAADDAQAGGAKKGPPKKGKGGGKQTAAPEKKAAPASPKKSSDVAAKKAVAANAGSAKANKAGNGNKKADKTTAAPSSVTTETTLEGSFGSMEEDDDMKANPGKGAKKESDDKTATTKQAAKKSKANAAPVAPKRRSSAQEGEDKVHDNKKKPSVEDPGPANDKSNQAEAKQNKKLVKDASRSSVPMEDASIKASGSMDDESTRSDTSTKKRGGIFSKVVKKTKGLMGRRGSLLGGRRDSSNNMDDSKHDDSKETPNNKEAAETKQGKATTKTATAPATKQDKKKDAAAPAKAAASKDAKEGKKKKQGMDVETKAAAKKEEKADSKKKDMQSMDIDVPKQAAAKKPAEGKKTTKTANKNKAARGRPSTKAADEKPAPKRGVNRQRSSSLSDIVRGKIREGLEPKPRVPKAMPSYAPKPAAFEPEQVDYQDSPLRVLDTYEDELTLEQLRAKVAKLEQQLRDTEAAEAKEVEEVVQSGRNMYEKLSKKVENVSGLPDDMSELDSVKQRNDEIIKYLKEENQRRRNENTEIKKTFFELHQNTVYLEKQTEQTLGYLEKLEDVYYQGELDKRQRLLSTLTVCREGEDRLTDDLNRRISYIDAEKKLHKLYDGYMAKLLIRCDKRGVDKGLIGLMCAISMGRHDDSLVWRSSGEEKEAEAGASKEVGTLAAATVKDLPIEATEKGSSEPEEPASDSKTKNETSIEETAKDSGAVPAEPGAQEQLAEGEQVASQ